MKFLTRMLGSLFLVVERFKGPKTVIEVKDVSNALGHLVGQNVMGYEISIYCQRIHYMSIYNSRLFRGRHSVYRVFSTVSKGAPLPLVKACELDMPFPAFYPKIVPERMQVKAAIDAYIDLLHPRVEQYKKVSDLAA